MTLDKTRYTQLVKHLGQAVELVGQGVKLAETSRLRTAREWLRRSRALRVRQPPMARHAGNGGQWCSKGKLAFSPAMTGASKPCEQCGISPNIYG